MDAPFWKRLEIPDADVVVRPGFFPPAEADALLAELHDTIAWKAESMMMFGKPVAAPRLSAWYGDPGAAYRYSGVTFQPTPWTEVLRRVKQRIEEPCGVVFNSVLANLYRDGRDGMGWHSDDERELGPEPVIGSVSFGAAREFQFQHKKDKWLRAAVALTNGCLLRMAGLTQTHWKHRIPKTTAPLPPRINLTFRTIIPR
ncbi:MAG: alpha-ketoglutarate-dependent dioxygenase AlkB family protein, partial [Planctomycetia bacterium]